MARPQIQITTSAASAAATPGQRLGTWFVAAQTERGPLLPDPTTPLYSIQDYASLYGTRASLGSVQATYDQLDAFWRTGGGAVLLSRVVGPAAVVASLNLMDRAGTPLQTLKVSALGPGAWYNTNITIAVTAGVGTGTYVITVNVAGVAAEVSPDLTTPTDAVAWSAFSKYIRVTDLASATAAPNNIPALLSATALASGADDIVSVADADWTAALNALPAEWGPGLVSKLGITTAAGHAGTMAHAAARNRFAILSGASGSTQGTLTTLAATVQAAATSPEYGAVFAPWVTIPPYAGGSGSRTIAPTGVVAGLISRQVTDGPANEPAAGARGKATPVADVQTRFTDAEWEILSGSAYVNVLRRAYSASVAPAVELYGYNTLAFANSGWRQIGAQLLRLQLIDELNQVAEQFILSRIDGKGQKLAEFNGALRSVLLRHADDGDLYPSRSGDAFTVDTTSVNTPETLAAGQLKASVGICVAPMAEFIFINIVKVPITQALSSTAA